MRLQSKFSSAVRPALERLNKNGFEAYLIGGSVRDALMGVPVGDIDITTNALPTEVKSVFSDCRVIETGIRHGTVTVLFEGEKFEITTYRQDGEYTDSRHPDRVEFSRSLKEDVLRRDFTVNGIAYSFSEGIRDFTEGEKDIERKIIRCIGDPERRFSEDALRILRALRFSSVLGFEIEAETENAIVKLAPSLDKISAERKRDELLKLLTGKNAEKVLLKYPEVIARVVPQIQKSIGFSQNNRHHIYDVYTHSVKALSASLPDTAIRTALFLHDIGKPHCATADSNGNNHFKGHAEKSAVLADEALKNLRLDNKTREEICLLVRYHGFSIMNPQGEPDKIRLRRLISLLGYEGARKLIEIQRCDNSAKNPEYVLSAEFFKKAYDLIGEIEADGDCVSLKDLKINGADLKNAGYRGEEIGKELDSCLDLVLEGKIPNRREELLKEIKKTVR